MRTLERNKQTFWYALYVETLEVEDDYGNQTGEKSIVYGNPKKYRANISAAQGETDIRQFGDNVVYDKVIVLNTDAPDIDEYSILWVDSTPSLKNGVLVTDSDGEVVTPHDYIVKKVAKSLNSTSIAISKVTVSG